MAGSSVVTSNPSAVTPQAADERERLELIDVLASGDGQHWPDFWENAAQRQIGETMYGAQADELLASSWLADREQVIRSPIADEKKRVRLVNRCNCGGTSFWRRRHAKFCPVRGRSGESG